MKKKSYELYSVATLQEKFVRLREEHIAEYGDLPWNNRLYDPFHVFKQDYNPNNIARISEEVMLFYFPKIECFTCTGHWPIREAPCYPKPKDQKKGRQITDDDTCFMNCRYSDSRQIIETLYRHDYPFSIYMGRELLVANYHYKFPVLIRATRINDLILHHNVKAGNILDGFDDTPGNHALVHIGRHTGKHTVHRNAYKGLVQTFNNTNKEYIPIDFNQQKQIKDKADRIIFGLTNEEEFMKFLFLMYSKIDEIRKRNKCDDPNCKDGVINGTYACPICNRIESGWYKEIVDF